ncbi:Protein DELETION OF SUV3 SUPPRESSOR 1(I), partial [Linum grandiflorum]
VSLRLSPQAAVGRKKAHTKARVHLSISLRYFRFNSSFVASSFVNMAAEQKPSTEDVKMDLFEDDDEFEEFAINQEWDDDKVEIKDVSQQWEDDWDDDDVNDDFSLQLRRELENNNNNNSTAMKS